LVRGDQEDWEGRKETPLAVSSAAREKVEGCVGALMDCFGVNQSRLSFLWEELGDIAEPSDDSVHDGKLEVVGVCLDQSWSTLIFTESEIGDLDHLCEKIHRRHGGHIVDFLRRLTGTSTPVLRARCLEHSTEAPTR